MAVRDPSPSLYNEDLAPAEERRWGAFSIFNVWTSDVHSLWGYYLAASLFLLCGSFINFVIAIGIGSLVIFFLLLVGSSLVVGAFGVEVPSVYLYFTLLFAGLVLLFTVRAARNVRSTLVEQAHAEAREELRREMEAQDLLR